ncbi:MAG: tol-pal system protein YbgF [Alphaproteobacteria bacterium]|nr:tol-pal system protein YbgF [Alphaproteobacteria bacterium]
MKRSVIALLILFALVATASPTVAQQDISSLINRINRLERELSDVQRSVYAGSPAPQVDAGKVTAPAIEQTTLDASGGAPTALARIEIKIQRFEADLRALTGRVEELGFQLGRTNDRLDRLQVDTDQRYRELTGASGSASGVDAADRPVPEPEPSLTAASTAPTPSVAAPVPADPTSPPPSRQSGTLGTLTGSDITALQSGGAVSAPTAAAVPTPDPATTAPALSSAAVPSASIQTAPSTETASIPPGGTPEQQYRAAFDYLIKHDYDKAQVAFQTFVQAHPEDPLAGNAQYWLGETYYVRERYQDAAVTFLEGYQTYPQSPKAVDNLLKLGMALAQIDRRDDACATFDKLQADFPKAPTNIKRRMVQERERLKCGR